MSTPSTPAPGRHQEFAIEPSRKVGYRIMRRIFSIVMGLWFRPRVAGREHIPAVGPVSAWLVSLRTSVAAFSVRVSMASLSSAFEYGAKSMSRLTG